MTEYTAMEKKAVVAARAQLWDALVAEGQPLADQFSLLEGDQIDRIISAVWDGLRASMQKQSGMGDIPF